MAVLPLNCNILFVSDPTLTGRNMYAAKNIFYDPEDPFFELLDDPMIFDFDYLGLDEDEKFFDMESWLEGYPYPTWQYIVGSMMLQEQVQAVVCKYIRGEWLVLVFYVTEDQMVQFLSFPA